MKFPLTTRYSDYDTKGHVNNAFFLTYFEAAKHLLWREVWKRHPDPPFVVAEATVRFLSPAMIGDPLEIDISTREIKTRSWIWQFRITDAKGEPVTGLRASAFEVYEDDQRQVTLRPPWRQRQVAMDGLTVAAVFRDGVRSHAETSGN